MPVVSNSVISGRSTSPTPSISSEIQDEQGLRKLERWNDADVRLLITIWSDHKDLFRGKATKKQVFQKIAEQFTMSSGWKVTGDQCLRKWGKLICKQKAIEDHNNQSGNDRKTWRFYDELSQCLAKDATLNPFYMFESSADKKATNANGGDRGESSPDETSGEELDTSTENAQTTESSDSTATKRKKNPITARCRKKPRSRSSASDMLQFLKEYGEKHDKVEEEKLKVLKEMKEQKEVFFNRFFEYMDKK